MPEEEFFARVVRDVDCGILLDVTNVYINAINHHYDPRRFIRALPAERILQAHYCGFHRAPDGYLLDTHAELTQPEVWELLEEALTCTDIRAVILERDDKFLPWEQTINEVRLAREIFLRHRSAKPPDNLRPLIPEPPLNVDRNGEEDGYQKELALFQRARLAMLLDEELAQAVDREGESALRHTGIGRDERRLLVAIPRDKRDLAGSQIRAKRRIEQDEREARRHEELAEWARSGQL